MQSELPFFKNEMPFNQGEMNKISGLSYIPNYISEEEEKFFLENIDNSPWQKDIKRWTQHYGFQYDYRARKIDYSMKIGELPNWSNEIIERLVSDKIFDETPDQLLVNNYEPGQGIAPHTDCEPCFLDTIVSISLGSHAIINYTKDDLKIPITLEPRSLVVMKGESRYFWKHGIAGRKKDKINGVFITRKRRVSLTFRKVVME